MAEPSKPVDPQTVSLPPEKLREPTEAELLAIMHEDELAHVRSGLANKQFWEGIKSQWRAAQKPSEETGGTRVPGQTADDKTPPPPPEPTKEQLRALRLMLANQSGQPPDPDDVAEEEADAERYQRKLANARERKRKEVDSEFAQPEKEKATPTGLNVSSVDLRDRHNDRSHTEWFWGGTAVLVTILALVFWGLLFVAAWGFYFVWVYGAPWFGRATKTRRGIMKGAIDVAIALGLFLLWLYVPSPFKGQSPKSDDSIGVYATPTPVISPSPSPAPLMSSIPTPNMKIRQVPAAVPGRSAAPTPQAEPMPTPEIPTPKISQVKSFFPSVREGLPYGFRIILQTNATISPIDVVVQCSGPIGEAIQIMIGSGLTAWSGDAPHGKNYYAFRIQSPPFTPRTPIQIDLFSATKITCQVVRAD